MLRRLAPHWYRLCNTSSIESCETSVFELQTKVPVHGVPDIGMLYVLLNGTQASTVATPVRTAMVAQSF
jgi:hypothetical protein